MLTKDLLVVRRYRGRIQPRYVDPQEAESRVLAESLIRLFQEAAQCSLSREQLYRNLEGLESHKTFKLVRGLAQLLERRCVFGQACAIEPKRLRACLFRRGYVTSEDERAKAFAQAAQEFNVGIAELTKAFWGDREEKQLLKGFLPSPPPLPQRAIDQSTTVAPVRELVIKPVELLKQYNLSLTQTLLFDALELTFTASGNYQEIFRGVKYLGLMYEAVEEFPGRVKVRVDGPASLFKETTKYGTSLAKLIPALTRAQKFQLTARIKDGDVIFFFGLDDSRRHLFPDSQDEAERFDSAVEENFARRIRSLMPDWKVNREPTLLKAGIHVFIPDFGFERRGLRCYLEIVGFWTPEYLQKKLAKLRAVEVEAPLLIAVDTNLKCADRDLALGEGKEVFFYEKTLPLEPVIGRLLELGKRQTREEAKRLREVFKRRPLQLQGDLISLEEIAAQHQVGVEALKEVLALDEAYQLIEDEDKIVSLRLLRELKSRIEALPEVEGVKDYFQVRAILDTDGLGLSVLKKIGYKLEQKSLLPEDIKIIKS